jgi:hypothetical protein
MGMMLNEWRRFVGLPQQCAESYAQVHLCCRCTAGVQLHRQQRLWTECRSLCFTHQGQSEHVWLRALYSSARSNQHRCLEQLHPLFVLRLPCHINVMTGHSALEHFRYAAGTVHLPAKVPAGTPSELTELAQLHLYLLRTLCKPGAFLHQWLLHDMQGTPGAEEAIRKARHDGIPVTETLQVRALVIGAVKAACGSKAATHPHHNLLCSANCVNVQNLHALQHVHRSRAVLGCGHVEMWQPPTSRAVRWLLIRWLKR